MVELSLRERLQPMLLDRLVDEERVLTHFELTLDRAFLARLGITLQALTDILVARGLTFHTDARADDEGAMSTSALMRLNFSAPTGRVSLAQLKALKLTPPGAPAGIELQSIANIAARNELNSTIESSEERRQSIGRLRENVCRDLAILLNSTSLDDAYDLSELAHVRRSVLNYGMPSLAGRAVKSLDLEQVARAVEEVIRQFEPRLTQVRVSPDTGREENEQEFHLRIDAVLWSQPSAQRLVLRTRISTESGEVSVSDFGAR
jgi:type VI secretion system protein ImpF